MAANAPTGRPGTVQMSAGSGSEEDRTGSSSPAGRRHGGRSGPGCSGSSRQTPMYDLAEPEPIADFDFDQSADA
jgi:hypothetical protein